MLDYSAILSHDPALLARANQVARRFAQQFVRPEVVGVVFLGAIARGYFDPAADIDIAVFKQRGADLPLERKFLHVDGLEVHVWLSDYEDELAAPWEMSRRWTYTRHEIFHDPSGRIARLIDEKVPLKPDEKRWLLMSGLVMAEWYANGLSELWIARGSVTAAHHILSQAVNCLFDALFGLNDQLVPDMKWRGFLAERLPRLPEDFTPRLQEILLIHAFTLDELTRRREAFMQLWREVQPLVEEEVGLTFDEMVAIV